MKITRSLPNASGRRKGQSRLEKTCSPTDAKLAQRCGRCYFRNMASLDFEKFAELLRTDATSFVMSRVSIYTGSEEFRGRGQLRVKDGLLSMNVALDGNKPLPQISGSQTREQFWKIGGIIEEQVPFWTLALPHSWQTSGIRFQVQGATFTIDRVHHLLGNFPQGSLENAILEAAKAEELDGGEGDDATAMLTDYEMVFHEEFTKVTEENPFLGEGSSSRSDTLRGHFGEFEYALIQRGKNCEVRMRSKKNTRPRKGELNRIFRALLVSIAFAHGQHAWPQFYRIRKGWKVLDEWARVERDLPRSRYQPVPETACANGARVQNVFEHLMACILTEDQFSKDLTHNLLLAREAGGSSTPHSVGTLGLCAVLEGLVALLHQRFVKVEITKASGAFEAKKNKLAKILQKQLTSSKLAEDETALKRLAGLVGSAQCYRPADKFEQLSKHFNLPWGKMEPVWKAWARQRNPRAHGKTANNYDLKDLIDGSRIAGGINILVLAAIGYSGLASLSKLEDEYLRFK